MEEKAVDLVLAAEPFDRPLAVPFGVDQGLNRAVIRAVSVRIGDAEVRRVVVGSCQKDIAVPAGTERVDHAVFSEPESAPPLFQLGNLPTVQQEIPLEKRQKGIVEFFGRRMVFERVGRKKFGQRRLKIPFGDQPALSDHFVNGRGRIH